MLSYAMLHYRSQRAACVLCYSILQYIWQQAVLSGMMNGESSSAGACRKMCIGIRMTIEMAAAGRERVLASQGQTCSGIASSRVLPPQVSLPQPQSKATTRCLGSTRPTSAAAPSLPTVLETRTLGCQPRLLVPTAKRKSGGTGDIGRLTLQEAWAKHRGTQVHLDDSTTIEAA